MNRLKEFKKLEDQKNVDSTFTFLQVSIFIIRFNKE